MNKKKKKKNRVTDKTRVCATFFITAWTILSKASRLYPILNVGNSFYAGPRVPGSAI